MDEFSGHKSPPVSVILSYNTTDSPSWNATTLLAGSPYPIDPSYMEWVPVVLLMAGMFGCCLGTENVPFVLASEYFPTAVRPYVSSNFVLCYTRIFPVAFGVFLLLMCCHISVKTLFLESNVYILVLMICSGVGTVHLLG